MQTFLPFADFQKSAQVLDRQRLGKQRVECMQILDTLINNKKAWSNHPAVLMWKGYEDCLARYGWFICQEWLRRGYKDTCKLKILNLVEQRNVFISNDPAWIGNEKIHASHRAALLYKNLEHYKTFGWTEQPKLEYYWPVVKEKI